MGGMHLPELPPTAGRVLALDLGSASPVAWLAVLLAVGYGLGLWRLRRRAVHWSSGRRGAPPRRPTFLAPGRGAFGPIMAVDRGRRHPGPRPAIPSLRLRAPFHASSAATAWMTAVGRLGWSPPPPASWHVDPLADQA